MGIVTGQVDGQSRASLLTPEITQWILSELRKNLGSFNKKFDEDNVKQEGAVKPAGAKQKPITPNMNRDKPWTGAEFVCNYEGDGVTVFNRNMHSFIVGITNDGIQARFSLDEWEALPSPVKPKRAEAPV